MDNVSLKHFLDRHPVRALQDSNGEPNGLFVTCPVRLTFSHLDKPREKDYKNDKGEVVLSWGGAFIVPAEADISVLKKAAGAVAAARFPGAKTGLKNPLKPQADQHAKGRDGFSEDGVFFNVDSQFAIKIKGAKPNDQGVLPDLDPASDAVYPGMWCLAIVAPYAYDKRGNKGVSFGLRGLQKLADDDEIVSSDAATDAFGAVDYPTGVSAPANDTGGTASDEADALWG